MLPDIVLPEGPFWTALASLAAGIVTLSTMAMKERREWRKAVEKLSVTNADTQKRENERCETLLANQNERHKQDLHVVIREQIAMNERVERAINEQTTSLTAVLSRPLPRKAILGPRLRDPKKPRRS